MLIQVDGEPLKYEGKEHPIGAKITMTDAEGRIVLALRRAIVPEEPEAGDVRTEPRRRRYRRRDMQAE